MNTSSFQSLTKRIDTYREEVITFQKTLTQIPAIGPENQGCGEAGKSRKIIAALNKLGIDELIELNAPDPRVPEGYRPNLLVKINGQSNDRTLWIMSHMDVVPPGDLDLWESDPFDIVIKDGKIYGRGTEDDHQGIVSSLLLLKALREEQIVLPFDLGFAIVSDEEAGSEYGIQYVLQQRSDLFQPADWIIIPDAGNDDGTMIEVAEKSILWIKCEIKGRQTHGSTPEKGINAHSAGARLIVKMDQLYQEFNHSDPLYDPEISTFEPTKKEANVDNINTIPGSDIIYFDCRILPDYSIEQVKNRIRLYADEIEEKFGVKISLSYPQDVPAPSPTPADSPVALALQKAVKSVLNRDARSMGIGGGTVAAYFREAGLPAVCWCTVDDTLHGPNEYCRIENVLNDTKVFAHVCLQK
ncbi:M20 family metallo-hydrolase [bacterium]|nr:M20 family metallo-hydrolase [bacterium]